MKLQTSILTAASALLLTTVAYSQVTLTDIGTTTPTPGTLDISQLIANTGIGGVPGLNYYWDDGANHPTGPGFIGQTFTTLANPTGYTLTSLAILTAGNGGGGQLTNQSFTLSIYSLSGAGLTNATLLNTFTATSALVAEGDWFQWSGLGVNLAPNSDYAYAFGRSPGSPGDWELLATATNLPYAGGQACEIVNAGGLVTYSTSNDLYDATFDLGLALPSQPVPAPPTETPASAAAAIGAGTPVTLVASSAGETPIGYQWQTDGGTGGAATNVAGATSTNLVLNTTGWAPGTYVYDFVASNVLGVVTSPTINITIVPILMEDLGSNAPTPGPNDIAQLDFTPGFYTPGGINYYTDDGAGHSAWAGQTFTTGSNADGYIMNSLTWKSSGNGNSFPVIQLYDLYIFSVTSNTSVTLLNSYSGYGGGAELDWLKFVGLNVTLAPNSEYAYAFGRDATATGWEDIASTTNLPAPYAGGQVCTIFPPTTGSTITFGNAALDATFDIGLTPSTLPFAAVPTYSPNVNPIYAGTAVTLSENASGTAPLSFQWVADNGTGGVTWTPVSGATTTNLPVDTTALTQPAYEYEVIVKNNSGSVTSAPVTLNIAAASAPIIVTDTTPNPVNEGYAGESVTYSASFAGTLPITYQWMVNTGSGFTPVTGNASASTETLVLANVQAGNAGTYYLSASNAVGGPVTSTPSTLTVLTDPGAPTAGSYGASVLATTPLAYWPLNETGDPSTDVLPAYDASGHNLDGVYGQFATIGVAGPTPSIGFPGFSANNTALQPQSGGQDTYAAIPSLNFNTNTATFTAWINPSANQTTYTGLIYYRNYNNSDAAGLGFGGTTDTAGMPALGYTWNSNSATTYGFNSGLFPPLGQWSFTALVIQPSNAVLYLYYIDPVSGNPDLYSAESDVTNDTESFNISGGTGGTNAIGTDPYSEAGRAFGGSIDQVAVFDTALSSSQILGMFAKATGLGTFPPSISAQPQSEGAYAGANVTFSAGGINGSTPFSYQWQFNGTNISGATNLALTVSNVTAADIGTYNILVKNSVTTTVSSNAALLVRTVIPGSYEAAVLDLNPLAYWSLNDDNGAPGNGVAYELVSGLTGTYEAGADYGVNGIEGPRPPDFGGFTSSNFALETFANVANSYVQATSSSLVASNLTYAMWINPQANVEAWSGLLMARGGVGNGFGFGGTANASGMIGLGYTWNQNNSDTWDYVSNLYPDTNEWSFVALVIEPSQATFYLMSANGGVQTAVNAIAEDSEQFGLTWQIGNDTAGTGGARTFPGMISGVGVFLSALSSNQLVSLYDAGLGKTVGPPPVTITIAKATAGNVTLSWSSGSLVQATNLSGPWVTNTTAVSPFTVAVTNSQTFYEVK